MLEKPKEVRPHLTLKFDGLEKVDQPVTKTEG